MPEPGAILLLALGDAAAREVGAANLRESFALHDPERVFSRGMRRTAQALSAGQFPMPGFTGKDISEVHHWQTIADMPEAECEQRKRSPVQIPEAHTVRFALLPARLAGREEGCDLLHRGLLFIGREPQEAQEGGGDCPLAGVSLTNGNTVKLGNKRCW